jgi:hypothetical protein
MTNSINDLRSELLKTPIDRDTARICHLLSEARWSSPAEMQATVDAIARHYPDDHVRKLATEIASRYAPSLQQRWERTVVDQISSLEQRAQRLWTWLNLSLSANDLINGLFGELKGEPLHGDADPRAQAISQYLHHANHSVRAAAAFAVCKCMVNQ